MAQSATIDRNTRTNLRELWAALRPHIDAPPDAAPPWGSLIRFAASEILKRDVPDSELARRWDRWAAFHSE